MSRFTQLALAASALVVSVSASAFASDLPNRKTVPVAPAPVYRPFSWNGVYGGFVLAERRCAGHHRRL